MQLDIRKFNGQVPQYTRSTPSLRSHSAKFLESTSIIKFKYQLSHPMTPEKEMAITLMTFFLLKYKWENVWLQHYLPTFLNLESRARPNVCFVLKKPTIENYTNEFRIFKNHFGIVSPLDFHQIVNIIRQKRFYILGQTQSEEILFEAYRQSKLYSINALGFQNFLSGSVNPYLLPNLPMKYLSSSHPISQRPHVTPAPHLPWFNEPSQSEMGTPRLPQAQQKMLDALGRSLDTKFE